MEDFHRQVMIKIAGWYDILLGILVFTISEWVFDQFNIPYPTSPFLYASGLFVLAYGYLLLTIPIDEPSFKSIAYTSAFVRLGFFSIVIIDILVNSEVIIGYLLLGTMDFITGLMIIMAVKVK